MIRKALLTALAGVLLAVPAQAQMTLDDVLNNYYEAVGGVDAWMAVNTMKATGSMMLMPGTEAPFSMSAKRPEKVRLEFTFQGMTGIQAYDGETAWTVMPFMGKTEPEEVPEEDADDVKEMADIEGALMNYADKGHTVEYVGEEAVEGTNAHKLKVMMENGEVRHYYLDAEYYVPIMVTSSREVRGTIMEFEQILSDYKDVDGLMIPHSMESRPKGAPQGQVITIDMVELNVDIDDSIFTMPEPEAGEGQ